MKWLSVDESNLTTQQNRKSGAFKTLVGLLLTAISIAAVALFKSSEALTAALVGNIGSVCLITVGASSFLPEKHGRSIQNGCDLP